MDAVWRAKEGCCCPGCVGRKAGDESDYVIEHCEREEAEKEAGKGTEDSGEVRSSQKPLHPVRDSSEMSDSSHRVYLSRHVAPRRVVLHKSRRADSNT